MRSRYLDYAISVVKGSELPDGRRAERCSGGYCRDEGNGAASGQYGESARVVGDVLGAITRMAIRQRMTHGAHGADFSLRYPLSTRQGNLASDGDGAAAMRYTELE